MKNLLVGFATGLFLISTVGVAAASIEVEFTIYDLSDNYWGYGAFEGNDANSDGVLLLSELISLEYYFDAFSENRLDTTLSEVSFMGTYTIATNDWANDAQSWNGPNNTAWITHGPNNQSSVNSGWAKLTTTVVETPAPVPLPATMLLFGSGLLGLIGVARRKKA